MSRGAAMISCTRCDNDSEGASSMANGKAHLSLGPAANALLALLFF